MRKLVTRRPHPGVIALAVIVGACGQGPSSVAPGSPFAASLPPPATATPKPTTSPPASVPPSGSVADVPSPEPSGAVRIDAALLGILPEAIEGNQITESTEAEASEAGDPALATSVRALATGFVVDSAGANWAVASVVALKTGAFSDSFYRGYRDSYDEGVCSQAGGVTAHAQATIGGHETEIATCAGGVHTYHVRLAKRDAIVSVSSLGDQRYGEQVIVGLRE